jgi:glycosyltransferase involved in cell wall biosynthesis
MSMMVTWLLPARNAGRYLEETLRSMESQSFHSHKVLAWDNGSTDATVEILKEWIPGRIQGRVVTDSPFESLGACLAAMVEEADTELLARIDADDICHASRLKRQATEMINNPRLVGCGVQEVTIDETGAAVDHPPLRMMNPADIRFQIPWGNCFMHPGMMLRRSVVLACGNYRDLPNSQDYDLWFRLSERGPLSNLPDRLLYYRKHSGSITAGRSHEEWPEIHRKFLRRYHGSIFPGSTIEGVELVWNFLSKWGKPCNRQAEATEELMRLAVLATRVHAWRDTNFFSTTSFYSAYRRIAPRGLKRSLVLKALRLSRYGIGVASLPLTRHYGRQLPPVDVEMNRP